MPQESLNKLKSLSYLLADPELSVQDKDTKLGEFSSLLRYVTDYLRNEQPVSEESIEVDPLSILGESGVPEDVARRAMESVEGLRMWHN